MARYIDAEKIKHRLFGVAVTDDTYGMGISQGIDMALKIINDTPTADVMEVKHGEWKEIRNAYGELEGWLCECGRESKIKENYCPNCGAKMDGKDINVSTK